MSDKPEIKALTEALGMFARITMKALPLKEIIMLARHGDALICVTPPPDAETDHKHAVDTLFDACVALGAETLSPLHLAAYLHGRTVDMVRDAMLAHSDEAEDAAKTTTDQIITNMKDQS